MGKISVSLPNGDDIDVESDSTLIDVAYQIGEGLGDDCMAGYVNEELVGKDHSLEDGDQVEVVTKDSDRYITLIRHSTAHVLAQALKRLYDDIHLAIGPPTDNGFYYDIKGSEISESDLDVIEEEMRSIISEDLDIERTEMKKDEALDVYEDNPFKTDILQNEADEQTVSFYEQGEFRDLCRGGHVESTGDIPAFKLMEVSGSYWRGDEENETLTRIHGVAFESQGELDDYLEKLERAEDKNHRVLGRKMNLFEMPDHTPAPQYLPKGMTIIKQLNGYIRDKNSDLGYEEVWTPELNRTELFEQSGHYDAFCTEGEMFFWSQEGTEYGLKPMNCANHASMFSKVAESYQDLPVRFSEFGTVYRHERSGSGSGLFRARGFTQDDGHAFVREDQLRDEVRETLSAIDDILSGTFGLDPDYKLETKPDNAIGEDSAWDKATDALINALEEEDLQYTVNEGDGAFYGPKIGADISDLLDREWTLGTVQVDFNIPSQMDVEYVNEDNETDQPIMIHRALIGSYERFLAILIEQTEGILPTWVSPTQVRVITVSQQSEEYADKIKNELDEFRTELDNSDRTIEDKIRKAHEERVSYMIIVGEDESESKTVSIRDAYENEVRGVDLEKFKNDLSQEINSKSNSLSVVRDIEQM